ncbi:MAG: hypothetical protein JKX68_03155 [Flavobacteriales bacterium]|nr:hypothetical protein [Flavobacteriales bacterium]
MAIDRKRLLYRLKFYGLGFGLGCVLVWATLIKDRDRPSFLPEGRVLEFFEDTDIRISDELKCKLECNNIPVTFMDSTFWANADVNFKESAVNRKPCPEHYVKSIMKDGREIIVSIENCEVCLDCEEDRVAILRSFINVLDKDKMCDC